MTPRKIWTLGKQFFNTIFPTALAYVNFMAMWGFFLALISGTDVATIGFGALGSIYCLNEWARRVLKEK